MLRASGLSKLDLMPLNEWNKEWSEFLLGSVDHMTEYYRHESECPYRTEYGGFAPGNCRCIAGHKTWITTNTAKGRKSMSPTLFWSLMLMLSVVSIMFLPYVWAPLMIPATVGELISGYKLAAGFSEYRSKPRAIESVKIDGRTQQEWYDIVLSLGKKEYESLSRPALDGLEDSAEGFGGWNAKKLMGDVLYYKLMREFYPGNYCYCGDDVLPGYKKCQKHQECLWCLDLDCDGKCYVEYAEARAINKRSHSESPLDRTEYVNRVANGLVYPVKAYKVEYKDGNTYVTRH